MKYCITSLIFNNYEPVREPIEYDKNCDYFLFTDSKDLKSDIWKVIYLKDFDTDKLTGIQKMLKFKYIFYKYIPNFKDYDYFIQIDHSIVLKKSLRPIIEYIDKHNFDMSIGIHPCRNNFIEEYKAWHNYRNLDQKYIDMFFENTKDYDYNLLGLMETTIKIYKNNNTIISFIDDMFKMLNISDFNDKNDQCYFTYLLYKYFDKLKINFHPAALYRQSDYMCILKHGSLENVELENPINKPGDIIKLFNTLIRINNLDEYSK